MSWWAWLLIWTGLVLALLAVLALGAWWLFRKSMAVLDDVADLAGKSGRPIQEVVVEHDPTGDRR